ncbi:MAG: SycD/LcrH family type III secretion system chaperone [Desulfovibrio sp.]|nr:SycD/LcrH family type III secretion system chaperone [Desulfovibrio sp.]
MAKQSKKQDMAFQLYADAVKKNIDKTAEAFGVSPDQFEEVRNALLSGAALYEILGIKRASIDARYALAYQLYQAGKMQEAESIFRWLCSYANTDVPHWMGLGACRQAQGNFDGAMEAYQMAALYGSLEDPAPFYYSGICLLKQQRKDDAKVALQTVLTLGDASKPEHKVIMDKAQTMLSGLETGA